MNENEQNSHQSMAQDHNHNKLPHAMPPYWKRMHQDWRFWVGLVFVLVAITIYIMSVDFTLQPVVVPNNH